MWKMLGCERGEACCEIIDKTYIRIINNVLTI